LAQDQPREVADRPPNQLEPAEGQQAQQGAAAGQRLGHPVQEQEVLGAGEDESARPIEPVHDSLEVGEEIRCRWTSSRMTLSRN